MPKEVKTGFSGVACPIWTVDGRHLLFLGNQDDKKSLEESLDWWVVSLDGSQAVKTGVLQRTRAKGLIGPMPAAPMALVPGAWTPRGDGVIFSARFGDNTNLWQIQINPRTFKAAAEPRRITWGTGFEWMPSVASQSADKLRIVFANLDENSDIWGLPISKSGASAGKLPRQLTKETSNEYDPNISKDGKKLVFLSNLNSGYQIWLKDLDTGDQTLLTSSPADRFRPILSPDRQYLTYSNTSLWDIHRLRLSDGADEVICPGCGLASCWISGTDAVFYGNGPGQISLFDLASRQKTRLLGKLNSRFVDADLSPDGRWVLFLDQTGDRIQIAPYRKSKIEESEWILVFAESCTDLNPKWASDGNAVLFISDRDGFQCIWRQALDPVTKHPKGPPEAVYHAHGGQYSMTSMISDNVLSVGGDLVVFVLSEHAGNIWMAEWK
jgi:eukaryotic-like serine/threonine-protein kinase